MRTAILIPAYNEESQIGKLVMSLGQVGHRPVVINDGSTDGTAEAARAGGAEVINHPKNMGKGSALKTGFAYILKNGYEAALIMDGDGQHKPKDIASFLEAAGMHENAMLVGNRMSDTKRMPLDRKVTNIIMSFMVSLICGQKIPDSQCGFRLLKRDLIGKMKLDSSRFEVESEMLIRASRAGATIISVPIDSVYEKESSQINPVTDTMRFLVFLIRLPFLR